MVRGDGPHCHSAGADITGLLGKISMSAASGEAVANMIQPLWLLPALAVAELNLRQVRGFAVATIAVESVVLGVAPLVMPFVYTNV
jgi:short-chain fatty acids transporter